jgi:4-hydroxy-tetrahydrodipicolinate synthase
MAAQLKAIQHDMHAVGPAIVARGCEMVAAEAKRVLGTYDYGWPPLQPETIARMAEFKNIAMVKEATGSLDQASQIIALTDLTVLSGDDSLTLPILSVGGRGVISVAGNIVPRDVIALCSAFAAGNISDAQSWHKKLFPLCRDMLGLASNPIPIKAAMKLLGRDTGQLRLPMTPLDLAGEATLRKTLTAYGVL